MTKDQYINHLEDMILNEVGSGNLCGTLFELDDGWCKENCTDKFERQCLIRLAELRQWGECSHSTSGECELSK